MQLHVRNADTSMRVIEGLRDDMRWIFDTQTPFVAAKVSASLCPSGSMDAVTTTQRGQCAAACTGEKVAPDCQSSGRDDRLSARVLRDYCPIKVYVQKNGASAARVCGRPEKSLVNQQRDGLRAGAANVQANESNGHPNRLDRLPRPLLLRGARCRNRD